MNTGTSVRKLEDYSVNWKRSILIDGEINEALVHRLTPVILSLRQDSNEPVTVGIDSPGGSLHSLDVLIDLLRGPDQDGRTGSIVAVATNKAYSAAANLLALGDYSVALGHASVLCHNVSYDHLTNVKAEDARLADIGLQLTAERYALQLADRMIDRLIWTYMDLKPRFGECTERFPALHSRHVEVLSRHSQGTDSYPAIDLAGFVTALWASLSSRSDYLIERVMDGLDFWTQVMPALDATPTYRIKNSRKPGLLDGARDLYDAFDGDPSLFEERERDLKLFFSLLVTDIAQSNSAGRDFRFAIDRVTREFAFFRLLSDRSHVERAFELMTKYISAFLSEDFLARLKGMSDEKRATALGQQVMPQIRLFWLFCVQLCRELFVGEHILLAKDAQLLGLIDEVCGGGHVQSKREFELSKARSSASSAAARKGGARRRARGGTA